MKQIFLFIFLVGFISCNKNKVTGPLDPGFHEDLELEINNATRNYHLYIPNELENAPIVLLFHGNGSSNSELIGLTNAKAPYRVWLDIAEDENIILAIPNGNEGSNNTRGWNDCREDALSNPESNDVLFVETLIDELINLYNADSDRVYAMGTSNGGHFSIRLAEELTEKIAAFGAVAASNPKNSECNSSGSPISAIFINGTDDPILPYEGGIMPSDRGEVMSADETAEYWALVNTSDLTPISSTFENLNLDDGCTVEKHLHINGLSGTEVVLYTINGGGHTEPSIQERYSNLYLLVVGNQNGDIEMAEEVWSFFKTKSK